MKEMFKPYWRKKMLICLGLCIYMELCGFQFMMQYTTILFESIQKGSGTTVVLLDSILKIVCLVPNFYIQKNKGRRTA